MLGIALRVWFEGQEAVDSVPYTFQVKLHLDP
jgi:hypothetical protein